MKHNFYKMSTTTSYLFDRRIPANQFTIPTQATYFATSSLAAASQTGIAYDPGSQIYQLRQLTPGNSFANNTTIYSEDKSPLGVEVMRRKSDLVYPSQTPQALTVPNVYTLNSKYTLRR